MCKKWLSFFLFLFSFVALKAQQKPLPDFFIHKGSQNAVSISWVNNFGDECIQLNVQRSSDSLLNFKTIFSTPAPELPTNGYTDRNPPAGRVFYRIFYMLNGGAYYFTTSRQPESSSPIVKTDTTASSNNVPMVNPNAANMGMVTKNKYGNISIKLRTPDIFNYKMDIYALEGNKVLFTIKRFESDTLILDKGSFLRKGRYRYRLYYNDKEKESGYLDIAQ